MVVQITFFLKKKYSLCKFSPFNSQQNFVKKKIKILNKILGTFSLK